MKKTTEAELNERFVALDKSQSSFRQKMIGAAYALRDAKDLAVERQRWELAAELRDQCLVLLRLTD